MDSDTNLFVDVSPTSLSLSLNRSLSVSRVVSGIIGNGTGDHRIRCSNNQRWY